MHIEEDPVLPVPQGSRRNPIGNMQHGRKHGFYGTLERASRPKIECHGRLEEDHSPIYR